MPASTALGFFRLRTVRARAKQFLPQRSRFSGGTTRSPASELRQPASEFVSCNRFFFSEAGEG